MGGTEIERAGAGQGADAYRGRHSSLTGAGAFVSLLAEGGMGAVLLADLPGGEGGPPRRVVVKVLKEALLADAKAAARFRREVATARKVAERLQSPRVVPFLGAADSDDPKRVHLVQPYYPDGSLFAFVRAGGSVEEGLRVLADAAEGLQGLHGHGYVHRDFCPHNVLVVREGGAPRGLLGDLGVSLPLEGDTVFSGTLVAEELELRVGHPGYTAPEGAGVVEADLYGLGATLYWLVAGSAPPGSTAGGPLRLPARSGCREGVGADLHRRAAAAVERLTTDRADGGFASAAEARSALVHVLDAVPARGAAKGGSPGRTWRRWLAAAAAVAVLGAVGLFARARLGGTAATETSAPQAPAPAPAAVSRTVPDPGPAKPDVAASLALARERIARGDVPRAKATLRDLLARIPAEPDASGLLALLLSRDGAAGLEEAVGLLERALAGSPARGDLRLALARAHAASGRPGEGARVLGAAPAGTTEAREIAVARVTLEGAAHRSR